MLITLINVTAAMVSRLSEDGSLTLTVGDYFVESGESSWISCETSVYPFDRLVDFSSAIFQSLRFHRLLFIIIPRDGE
jgi:hypothetical protein